MGYATRILTSKVFHAIQSLRTRLCGWRATHPRGSLPDHVIIGTLRRPNLAIAIRAKVVLTDTTPPPINVFLDRMVSHPISPFCPRCSLPLERWSADDMAEGAPLGYECRPCDTRIRWKPSDVLSQMKREVRRNYAYYWQAYQQAIHDR